MEQNMQYIYQVYQDGSFTKAAEKLYLTQPALSIAIRQEEKRMGMALFDRSRRPLGLTPAGEAYIRAVERMKYLEEIWGGSWRIFMTCVQDACISAEPIILTAFFWWRYWQGFPGVIRASGWRCPRTAPPDWQSVWNGGSWISHSAVRRSR